MKELLEIIYETEEIMRLYQDQNQSEKEKKMRLVFDELSVIDHKMDLHFKSSAVETAS